MPSDPDAETVPLDVETMAWLKEDRPAADGRQAPGWGHRERAAADALILYDQHREDAGWTRFLALHRHGGIEVGLGRLSNEFHGNSVFRLRPIIGAAWNAAALQVAVNEMWPTDPPFEIVIGLRNTNRATLGDFAEGWSNPGEGLGEYGRCLDDNVLLRQEVRELLDPMRFAMDLGDRIELAFGTTHRRHVANRGQYEGEFDPRYW